VFQRIAQSWKARNDDRSHLTLDRNRCELAKSEAMQSQEFGNLSFEQAFPIWLDGRKKIAQASRKYYREYFRAAAPYFGAMRLCEIHIGHVREYQTQRQAAIRAFHGTAVPDFQEWDGAGRINHELNTLSQVMRPCGLWEEVAKFYEPLPLPPYGPGIALTDDEELHLMDVARSRPRWMVAYCCGLVSRNTTRGPKEIRYLRLARIDLVGRHIHIREGVKNGYRERAVPLNDDALWAMEWLVARYRTFMRKAGIAEHPEHFVLFHRAHVRGAAPDPTRPLGSWKKAHYAMRAEAAKKFPRLATVRSYDWRHTGCTRLLEDPSVSYPTIEKMMGHKLGSKTKQVYDHVRDASLRAAAAALNSGHTSERKPAGVVSIARAVGKAATMVLFSLCMSPAADYLGDVLDLVA